MSNQIQYYKDVIDIITDFDRRLTSIEVRLAKEHPKLFVELAGSPKPKLFDVILVDPGEMIISCIKAVRQFTGLGLKEAKDLIDSVPSKILDGLEENRAIEIVEDLTRNGFSAKAQQQ